MCGVCLDRAKAISRVNTLIKQKALHVVATHCMLHKEAPVVKKMDNKLNQLLQEVIQVANFKARPMKHRLFTLLHKKMGTHFEGLLLHCIMYWLSWGQF